MNPSDLASLLERHWLLVLVVLYAASDLVVAITPRRYRTEKWYGFALVLMHFAATHLHADDPRGTLKIPFTNTPLRLGGAPPALPPSERPTQPPRRAS